MTLVAPAPIVRLNNTPLFHPLFSALARWRRARRTRLTLHSLCDRQLRDVGLDPGSVRPPGPVMTAPAGLVANLTAMR